MVRLRSQIPPESTSPQQACPRALLRKGIHPLALVAVVAATAWQGVRLLGSAVAVEPSDAHAADSPAFLLVLQVPEES